MSSSEGENPDDSASIKDDSVPAPAPERHEVVVKKSSFNSMIAVTIAAVAVAAFLGGYVVGGGTGDASVVAADTNVKDTDSTAGSKPTDRDAPSSASRSDEPSLAGSIRTAVLLGDDPVKGSKDAPVTIVEFSDYQCPFCKRWFDETLPLLNQNYISSGQVKVVYKDFPLERIHPNARAAALASECAHEQGKFWQYHDTLFELQSQWARLDADGANEKFKEYASELELDESQFESCLTSEKYSNEVLSDLRDGVNYGVNGTPAFFIGSEKDGFIQVRGAQPYSVFEQVIENELRG